MNNDSTHEIMYKFTMETILEMRHHIHLKLGINVVSE